MKSSVKSSVDPKAPFKLVTLFLLNFFFFHDSVTYLVLVKPSLRTVFILENKQAVFFFKKNNFINQSFVAVCGNSQ